MDAIWLVLLLPLLGAITCGALSKNLGRGLTGGVACGSVGLAFAVAAYHLAYYYREQLEAEVVPGFEWLLLPIGDSQPLVVNFDALVDHLSLTLLCVITGVGFLIHWFATDYMEHDRDYGRFFTYLNLFVAAMTLLVLASDLAVLLIGWGGVGFASYGLIGFWHHKPSAVSAARKAFVINVLGDIGLMIAIFMSVWFLNETTFLGLADKAEADPNNPALLAVAVFMLVAAYAKSAQLPLHTWLPDAMEGPTPVSALIHAATMVTAGVYLVVRAHPVFEAFPSLAGLVALLGMITALVAAICAVTQTDLKRVLAYSTMSQLGYMFLAAGLGAYSAAVFHLVTHAFFKALLFLSAGIVIHATHEQDMRKLGGLYQRMPAVGALFLVGGLCLAGFPLTSGFYSKEAILMAAEHAEGPLANILYWPAVLTAVLTAYYTARAYLMTFHGQTKFEGKVHLPGAPMLFSCSVLAILALVAGAGQQEFDLFFHAHGGHEVHLIGLIPALVLAALGLGYALHHGDQNQDWASQPSALLDYFRSGWRFDDLYQALANGFRKVSTVFSDGLEPAFGEAIPKACGEATEWVGDAFAQTQTGYTRHYALMLLVSVATFMVLIFFLGGFS